MKEPNDNSEVTAAGNEVGKIALRLPSFWTTNPKLYFAQIEANFTLSNISAESTKFCCLISALDEQVMLTIADLIAKPDLRDPYTSVKNRLIEEFSVSESKRIKTLLQDLTLGDSKPSALLRRMRDLAGTNFTDQALKSMWLSLLPPSIQTILSVSKEDLDDLAGLADRVFEVTNTSHNCSAVNVTQDVSLKSEIQSLRDEIISLKSQVRQLSRSRSFSRGRYGNKRKVDLQTDVKVESDPKPTNLCWYHKRFANKANKCVQPCEFDLN